MTTSLQIFNAKQVSKTAFTSLVFFMLVQVVCAGNIVKPASSGMNISADNAANANEPSFTQVGNIVISETKSADFANTAGVIKTMILTAPQGWIFNTNAGTVSAKNAKDFTSVSMNVAKTTITIKFMVKGTANMDAIEIAAIEVQAIDGAVLPSTGNIYMSKSNHGTAIVNGLIMTNDKSGTGGTDFGSLSQTAGNATKLVFESNPGTETANASFEHQPIVITQDQFGNATSNGLKAVQNVKFNLSSGTGSLVGTVVMNIGTDGGNGRINCQNLMVTAEGTKKIMASSGSLTFAVSKEFTVNEEETSAGAADDFDPELVCYNSLMSAGSSSI